MGLFGFGKSRDQKFAEYAERACESSQTITIKIREAYPLVLALEQALMKVRGVDKQKAFQMASDGIVLICPRCGVYTDEARDLALLGGEGGAIEQSGSVIFGGPISGALGQGKCPGCKGQKVEAIFGS